MVLLSNDHKALVCFAGVFASALIVVRFYGLGWNWLSFWLLVAIGSFGCYAFWRFVE